MCQPLLLLYSMPRTYTVFISFLVRVYCSFHSCLALHQQCACFRAPRLALESRLWECRFSSLSRPFTLGDKHTSFRRNRADHTQAGQAEEESFPTYVPRGIFASTAAPMARHALLSHPYHAWYSSGTPGSQSEGATIKRYLEVLSPHETNKLHVKSTNRKLFRNLIDPFFNGAMLLFPPYCFDSPDKQQNAQHTRCRSSFVVQCGRVG